MKKLFVTLFFLIIASCAHLPSTNYPTSSYVKINILDENALVAGWGSGVVVGRDQTSSTVLTAAHVCDAPYLEVSDLHGQNFPAFTIRMEAEKDLCLVWVPEMTHLPKVKLGAHPKLGDKVYAISSPRGFRSAYDGMVPIIEGTYNGHYTLPNKIDKYTHAGVTWDVFAQPLAPGSSGGMVLNDKMELISITVRGFRHDYMNGGVEFKDVRNFLYSCKNDGILD